MGKYIDPATAPFVDAEVLNITKVIDGDSGYMLRQFDPLLTDSQIIIAVDRRPMHYRLVIVNTPEHPKDPLGWAVARTDSDRWVADHIETLRARTYGYDDFGRLLTDLYDSTTGESLSAHLIELGWPTYLKGKS